MELEKNIPEGWVETSIGELAVLLTDYVANGSFASLKENVTYLRDGEGYARLIRLADHNKNYKGEAVFVNEHSYMFLKKSKLYPGDLIISNVGEYSGTLFRAPNLDIPMTLGPNSILMKFGESDDYMFYFLQGRVGKHLINTVKSGSANPKFNKTEFKKIEFIIPPITEQKAIAKVLTVFDDKIELLQAQNKTLETMAQTIFKEWFGKYQIGDELPEGWRVGKLGNEFDITIGRTPPRKETQWFSDRPTGKKWISIKDMGNCGTFIYNTSEYLTDEAIEKFNIPIIPTNTTILSFKMTVGKLTITTEDMLSNEAIAHLKIKNDSNLTSEFIYLFLRDLNFNSLGSTSSIVTAINSTIIKGIDFIIPKDELMNSFQKKILPIFKKIQNNTSQVQSLTKTRDTLLPKLMSGQVRVNNIKNA